MKSEFLSIGNGILLFTAFFCLWKPLLAFFTVRKKGFSCKVVFHYTEKELAGTFKRCRKKKMIYTSRKISCQLARISSFYQNCFLLIAIMFSTSIKIPLTKKYCFHKTENKFFLWKLFPPGGFHQPKKWWLPPAKKISDQNTVSTRQNIGFQRNPLFRLVETVFPLGGNRLWC